MKRSMILGAGTFALATAIAGFAGGYLMAQKPTSSENVDSSAPQERKVLYYRNPMGLPDTSPVPKKDSMGMDYIAVYEGEESGSTVTISPEKIQLLGVLTSPVERRVLTRTLIAEKVWEASYDLETNLIDVYVRRLRQKFERAGGGPFIKTVRGTGYQLA